MNNKKFQVIALCGTLVLLLSACAGTPEKNETSVCVPWYYTYTVLLTPDHPARSLQLDLAMSLLQLSFPEKKTEFLNQFLYAAPGPDAYKDKLIEQQREEYRARMAAGVYTEAIAGEEPGTEANWRYMENLDVKSKELLFFETRGLVIERDCEIWTGGAHPLSNKDYYVLDLEDCTQIKIDDLFTNFRSETIRKIVYAELRKYSKLKPNQPLSEGIFFRDEPELSYNFFVTEAGLGLYWNPYEIAPYSEGSIEIILPWRSVRPFLKCAGLDLLTKFNIYLLVI